MMLGYSTNGKKSEWKTVYTIILVGVVAVAVLAVVIYFVLKKEERDDG